MNRAHAGTLQHLPAGFFVRVGASILDWMILNIVVILLYGSVLLALPLKGNVSTSSSLNTAQSTSILTIPSSKEDFMGKNRPMNLLDLIVTLGLLFYFAGLESSQRGATLGKRISGLQVTNLEGNQISFLRACARSLCCGLNHLLMELPLLFVALRSDKRGLHDLCAGTQVQIVGKSRFWLAVLIALSMNLLLIALIIRPFLSILLSDVFQ